MCNTAVSKSIMAGQTLTGLRKEECLGTATTVTQVLLNSPFTSFLVVLSERSYTVAQHYPFHSCSLNVCPAGQ